MSKVSERISYELSGGGTVEVFKPFGQAVYFALVTQNGRYPEAGKFARNIGRSEYSVVLEGEFTYSVDGTVVKLGKDEAILVGEGSRYSIEGQGRILVFVTDGVGGKTEIGAD